VFRLLERLAARRDKFMLKMVARSPSFTLKTVIMIMVTFVAVIKVLTEMNINAISERD
jgi:hypothetical protein